MENKTSSQTDNLVNISDKLNLANLRLPQNYGETIGVKKHLITVPVGKPDKQSFVRVRSGEEWRLETAVIVLKDEHEHYLLSHNIATYITWRSDTNGSVHGDHKAGHFVFMADSTTR